MSKDELIQKEVKEAISKLTYLLLGKECTKSNVKFVISCMSDMELRAYLGGWALAKGIDMDLDTELNQDTVIKVFNLNN